MVRAVGGSGLRTKEILCDVLDNMQHFERQLEATDVKSIRQQHMKVAVIRSDTLATLGTISPDEDNLQGPSYKEYKQGEAVHPDGDHYDQWQTAVSVLVIFETCS